MDVNPHASVSDLARAVRTGRCRSRDLVELYLDRIARLDPPLNAVVTVDADAARRQADDRDREQASGRLAGPLHGVPVTIKDAFETAGLRTTAGSPDLAGHVSGSDAVAVARYRAAGAVIVGKTNLPSGATGQETANPVFGRTSNPWDLTRTPGGSSGGAAAALAAGLTGLDLGSDSGGSIRQPAHCCGVLGHAATHGLVPLRGHLPQVGPDDAGKDVDLMTVGPLARSADDLALALRVLVGPEPAELPGVTVRLAEPAAGGRRLRVAAWLDDPALPTDRAVLEPLEAAVEALGRTGAEVEPYARPGFDLAEALEIAFALWVAASSERTPAEQAAGLTAYAAAHPDDPSLAGQRARAETMGHREWLLLDGERRRLRRAWDALFDRVDVLVCPIIPVVAVPHDPDPAAVDSLDRRLDRTITVNGAPRPYLDQLMWNIVTSVAGLPATAVPVGTSPDGLPVGLQVVGPRGADLTTIDVAGRVAAAAGPVGVPPGFG